MSRKGTNDIPNYLKLSEPFADANQANRAVEAFYAEVAELRKEHNLPDVHVVVRVNIDHGEHVGSALSSAHFGNSMEAAPMCAWSYGRERAQYKAHLGKLMNGVENDGA